MKLFNAIILFIFNCIIWIISFFIAIIRLLFNIITGNTKNKNYHNKQIKTNKTFKHNNKTKTYEYDKKNNIWHLTEEDKKIAKEERMSPEDYIEAEERDDDNLDDDD